jgi:hypothetical protein
MKYTKATRFTQSFIDENIMGRTRRSCSNSPCGIPLEA